MFERFFRPNGTSWHRQKIGALLIVLLLSTLVAGGAVIKNWNKVSAASAQIIQNNWFDGVTSGIAGANVYWSYYESKDANITAGDGNVSITTSRVTTPPSDITPSTNVEGYWTFDETGSATVVDSSGNSRNGSFHSYEARGTGENTYNTLNSSADITDAYSNWIAIPANAAFRPTSALTVELWYKPSYVSSSTFDILDSSVPGAPGNRGGYVLYHQGNVLGFQHANGDVSSWTTVTADTIRLQADKWYHITAVFDGTADTLSLYVNGVLAGQVADTNTIGYVGINTTNPIVVGNAYAAEYYNDPLRPAYGFYDNLVIYSRALPASEISSRALQIKDVDRGTLVSNVFDIGTGNGWTSFTANHASIGATTTLNGSISDTDTSLTLTDGNRFMAASYFKIENEILYCAGKSGATFNTCTRGLLGTTAASHSNNIIVTGNLSTLYFATSDDNSTWSDWTTIAPLSSQTASLTGLTDSRYIKYKMELYGDGIIDASFSDVTINYATLLPDAVTDLSALGGNTEAVLSWTAPDPGSSAITDYLVEYGETSGWPANATTFADGTSITPSATVTSLTNDTNYSFRVTTVNANGSSGVSNTATVTPTLHCVPIISSPGYGYGISNAVLSGVSGGNTISNATSPYDAYTIYTASSTTTEELRQGYFYNLTLGIGNTMDVTAWIDYDDDGSFEAGEQLGTNSYVSTTSTLTFTVPGGAALGDHVMRIVGAYNGYITNACSLTYGEVEDYTVSILAPFATPDGVTDLAATGGNAQAVLTWSAPNAGSSAITDYIVEYGATSGWPANAATFSDGVSATTGATVTGLTNDINYSFRVTAVNGNGNGEVSNTATVTPTLHCVPTVSYPGYGYGINNVTLSGVSGGNTISNATSIYNTYTVYATSSTTTEELRQGYFYDLTVGIGSNTDVSAWIDYDDDGTFEAGEQLGTNTYASSTTTLNFTVPGGAALGDHVMRIVAQYAGTTIDSCASTTYGEYEDYTVSILAPNATPDGVTNLAATGGNAQAVLTWSAPNAGSSAITDYIVEYGATSGWPANAATFSDGVSATTGATVTGLTNETDYTFRVTAVNGNGNGEVSNTATAIPSAYCLPTITNSGYGTSYGINQVVLNDYNGGNTIGNASATTLGYTNYAPTSTTTESLMQAQTYTVSLGLAGGSVATGIWIDFNQDNTFDGSEQIGVSSASYYADAFVFQVPVNAATGTTKMRVGTDAGGYTVTGCGPSNYGEYEDYQITILAAVAGVYRIETDQSTAVQEGSYGDTFTVNLGTQPTDDVTLTLTPDSQLTVESGTIPVQLTFTSANWSTPQTVNVGAVDDLIDEAEPHSGVLSFSASSNDTTYNGMTIADLTVSVSDNDTAGITLSNPGNINVTEGTGTDSYTFVLNTQPTADVTITATPYSQVSVNGSTSPTSITFTSANWSTPQAFTVAALTDYVTEGNHTGMITHATTSSDTHYNGISTSLVTAYITDTVITQGVTITDGGYSTPAASVTFDGSQLYVRAINSVASGTLSATITNTTHSDSETITLTEGNGTNYPLGEFRGSITTAKDGTPTSSNNTIEGINGDLITAAFTATGTASTLENFEGYTSTANMHTTDWFDMIFGYSAGASTASSPNTLETTGPETGNSSAKWLQKIIDKDGPDNLFGSANDNSTLTTSINNSSTTVSIDVADGSVFPASNFKVRIDNEIFYCSSTTGNTLNSCQRRSDGMFTHSSSSATVYEYDDNPWGMSLYFTPASGQNFENRDFTFKFYVDDTAKMSSTAHNFGWLGTGGTASNLNIILVDGNGGSLTGTTLSIGSLSNGWQTLTLQASDFNLPSSSFDYNNVTGMLISASSGDGALDGTSYNPTFKVDDLALSDITYTDTTNAVTNSGVTVNIGDGVNVTEGTGSDTYTLVLLDQPTDNVTLTVTPDSQVSVNSSTSPVQLTFTSGNWNTPQTVTVAALTDALTEGAHTGTITHSTSSADLSYNSLAVDSVTANITDVVSSITTTIRKANCIDSASQITEGTVCLEVDDASYGTNSGAPDVMEIIVTSSGGDAESINLTETDNSGGLYQGTLTVSEASVTRDDGTLQVAVNDTIKEYYPYTYKFVSPTTSNTTSTTFGSFIAGDSQCPGGGNAYSGTACSYLYGSQITETGGNPALEQTAFPLEFNAINQGSHYTGQLTLGDSSLTNFPFSVSTTTHSSGYGYSYLISEQITPANIDAVNFSWHGSNGNVSGKDTKLYLWNGTSNLYEVQSDSLANNTSTITELETTLGNISGYLESNRIYLAVMSNTNDLGYNSVDYAELKVGANATQDANRIDSATYAGLPSFAITESNYSTLATEITLGNPIYVKLNDATLAGTDVQAADITVGSDHETITLTETTAGTFTGSMTTASATAVANDGTLQGSGLAEITAKLLQTASIDDFESLSTGTLSSAWNTIGYPDITVETTHTNFVQDAINSTTNKNGFIAFKSSYQSAHESFGTNGVQITFKASDKTMLEGTTGSTFSPMALPVPLKNVSVLLASGAGPDGGGVFEINPSAIADNQWVVMNLPQSAIGSYGPFGALNWADVGFFIIAAATGNGTTGNNMTFSLDNVNKLTTTALYTDTAAFAATGPSCGAGNACTGVGVSNAAPVFTSATNDSSDNSTPTNNGSTVSFTATATDSNGDQYYLIVCDSAGISAGDNAAPTCTGTQICLSSVMNQGEQTSCTSAAVSTSSETVSWVSYACDKVTGGGACSSVSDANSPYAINHRPAIASVNETDTGSGTIEPGDTVRVSASITDTDSAGTQDQVVIVTCADGSTFDFNNPGDGASTSGCSGGISNELCRSTAATPGTETCDLSASLTSIPTAHGNYNYEIFAYDSHGFDATESSAELYAVTDVAPVVDSITLIGDGDSEFNLSVVSSTTNFDFSAAVHDDNGDGDLVSANGKLFDSTATGSNGEGTSSCDDNTATNPNAQQECYTVSSCTLGAVSTPGTGKTATGTDQNATASCTAPLYFMANPSPTATPTWKGYVSVADGTTSDNNESSSPFLVMELLALDIKDDSDGGTITLNYPPLNPGQSTSTPLAAYVANVGNVPLDTKVKGTNMCTEWASGYGSTCNGASIPVGQQEYSADSGIYGNGIDLTQTDPASACALNTVPRRIRYDLYTNSTYNIPLYFNIALPATQATGSYTGQNTFTAYSDSTCP